MYILHIYMWYVYIVYVYIIYVHITYTYVYIYVMEYYSATKNNEILPFVATWVDLENIILSDVKSYRERQISLTCRI